ncbi:MAG: hypothetical protein A2W91_06760 [Bacteroidetes bacterium GWF2_38_335]|nr:MAG: hypothetical protein A2W91_06760 [Bacteroidetes bacterium GWF2_38_335]OFY79849.1 MAG: hypothetical protein A2281_09320 [Bacteroidetes bacterium RIFOXYA12_FULL_38_20]HBS84917.1 hypothetical protein [Bacteroidales bacterium]
MITNTITKFLNGITVNNNKEWFNANKELYLEAKADFEKFIAELIAGLRKMDPEIGDIKPSDCIFRIYKDVRFSKDKLPYKNNFGAYMVKGGKKSGHAGYYFHVEPDNSFLSGGIYMPMPPILNSVRKHIHENVGTFLKITENPDFKKYFGEVQGSKLVSAPKGYAKDLKHIELLKLKDFYVLRGLSDKELKDKNLISSALEGFKKVKDFNGFINEGIVNNSFIS